MTKLATRLADEGLGEIVVVCGYLDRATGTAMGVDRLGRPKGSPTNSAAVMYRRRGRHQRGEAPPAELRRLRRVPALRPRRHPAGDPHPRRRRRAGDLRGPLAGRRAGGGHPGRRCGAPAGREQFAVRGQQGRRPRRAGQPPGPRGRLPAGLREPDRRAGRAGLRRRLADRRCRGQCVRPGAAVRAGQHGGRPRPAGPDRYAGGRARGHPDRAHRAARGRRFRRTSRSPTAQAPRLSDEAEMYRRSSPGCATTW